YQKNIPYSSLLQALRNLIRTLLTESDERLARWKTKLQASLGRHGQVMTEVLPELGSLIGPQPPVPPLPPVESRNRFNQVFNDFLACLASAENPLVLFIDDLQWCDSATFDFLDSLFAHADEHPHLYFIGAYRDTEVDSAHPLTALVRAMHGRRQPLAEIALAPLEPRFCHEMVAYILDATLDQTRTLARFLTELTEGNPLFVSESLSYLRHEELLDASDTGEWQWNIDKIRSSEMPSTVVDLFGAKVRKLPPETLEILGFCACMGNRFTPEDIALIKEFDFAELYEKLRPVLSLGLLTEHKNDIQFVHDRVQEAVLRLLYPARRKLIHWQIGQHLLRAVPPETDPESLDNLFTIVAHLNLGQPDEPDRETVRQLSDINYHAGNKALNALASQAANEYFARARGLLPDDSWQSDYRRSFDIYRKQAKTELMCGRSEQSQALIEQLIAHSETDLDKAEALAEQTTSLSSVGNFIEAIATANRGLAYFGRSIAEDPDEARAKMKCLMAEIHLDGHDLWDRILHMPFTDDRRARIELAFYSELIPDLYMSGMVPQLYLSAAQSTQLCLAGGMDESVIYSFSIMGLNLGEQEQFELAFRYEDLAHELCERHPNTFGATRGMNGIVWCNMHSRSHPAEIAEYCLKSIRCGKNCGDHYNAGLSYGPLMWNLIVLGADFSRVEHYAKECLDFSRKNQLSFSVGLAEAVQMGWIAPLLSGRTAEPMDDRLALWERSNHIASVGSYHALKGFSHYFLGECEQAQIHLDAVEQYLNGLTDNVLKRQWYVVRILTALRRHEKHGKEFDRARVIEDIGPILRKLEVWAGLGPLLRPYLALIRAELARGGDDFTEARARYLDALDTARGLGYVFLEGFLNQRLGQLLHVAA
ncbi:MAG: hypothetical protein H6R26_3303, partial [Proteobacteria bacterium]|nr:hypothetical protein [Pseudomonadota bacterium]